MNTNTIRNRLTSVSRTLILGLSFFLGQAQAQVTYDGIYQWSSGNFLSLHQDGTNIIATIYFVKDGDFTFPATAGVGTLPVPQLDVFDLMSGQVTGSTATIYGTRFQRACNVGYSLTFNADATITVTRTGHSNTATADSAGISCSAILAAEASTLTVPKIRFNPTPPATNVQATFPLAATYANGFTTGLSLNGTAVDGADTYTMSLSITPAADEVFEGVLNKKSLGALTMKKNGAVLTADAISYYYTLHPFIQTGARYSNGSYAVATSITGNFPTTARVGDAGTIGTLTLYTSASKSAVNATTQSTWTMEADTASTAFGCVNSIVRDAAGTQIGTAAGCTKIDTNGNVLGMRYTLNVQGKTLVFN